MPRFTLVLTVLKSRQKLIAATVSSIVWYTGRIRLSRVDVPVYKELENSKRSMMRFYLRECET
jgi:hypothetical protein